MKQYQFFFSKIDLRAIGKYFFELQNQKLRLFVAKQFEMTKAGL